MTTLSVSFFTLGCKLNQLETESMADMFSHASMMIRPFGERVDLCIVNTCTVTSKAEQKARHSIRKALSLNPDTVVLVTGCYAQMDPSAIALLHQRIVVLPGEEKSALLGLAEWLQENWQGHGDLLDAVIDWHRSILPGSDRFAYEPDVFSFHSRPSIKIEDGCDNRCAYCRVCLARGPAVSLSKAEILSRVRALEAKSKSEVVLTGVNLSHYKDGETRFPQLLEYLIEGTERIAFRISSYEPEKIDLAFLKAFSSPRVRPHVHLAAQSGSSNVLRRMARPYSAERIREAVAALRSVKNDPFIATDIIAGFPGETDSEFEETLSLCRELDFAWIHAFPFSARPGTRAFDMRPKIPERIAGERVATLNALASQGKHAYAKRWIGREVELVVENAGEHSSFADEASGFEETDGPGSPRHSSFVGTSENYLKLSIPLLPEGVRAGSALRVRIIGLSSNPSFDAFAKPIEPIEPISKLC
jgi:threonylcarbamoyladenosine tRNA methylthiotransferase MtaB